MNRFEMLKTAKRKKGLTVRDYGYHDLEELVKEGVLDKSFPKRGRGVGWPYYKLSRRGKVSLKKYYSQRNAHA